MPTPQTTRKKGDLMVSLLANVDLVNHFERIASGKWTCIKQIDFATTRGRVHIAPGTTFTVGTNLFGIDMAFLLEREYERRQAGNREW
jgi:hypothetical protein